MVFFCIKRDTLTRRSAEPYIDLRFNLGSFNLLLLKNERGPPLRTQFLSHPLNATYRSRCYPAPRPWGYYLLYTILCVLMISAVALNLGTYCGGRARLGLMEKCGGVGSGGRGWRVRGACGGGRRLWGVVGARQYLLRSVKNLKLFHYPLVNEDWLLPPKVEASPIHLSIHLILPEISSYDGKMVSGRYLVSERARARECPHSNAH